VLIGKRLGSHSPYYSIPGGKLELGESFESAAIREVLEETGLKISKPRVVSVTNNLRTFASEDLHYISIILHTDVYEGEPIAMEPSKCAHWEWIYPDQIPHPQFDASEFALDCFLKNEFYISNQK